MIIDIVRARSNNLATREREAASFPHSLDPATIEDVQLGGFLVQYARTVLAYHGCDAETAKSLLNGEPSEPSENAYDWLGRGIYFWEHGVDRAFRFAKFQKSRGKIQTPAVVGAVLQLGRCFDLMDTRNTVDPGSFYPFFESDLQSKGVELPKNQGKTPDLKLRHLDCAVINAYLTVIARTGELFDTVRCGFTEGKPIYPGAMIQQETHIQIAVRNPACILGVFRPLYKLDSL